MFLFVDKCFGKPTSPWTSVQIALVFEIAKHIMYISPLGVKNRRSTWTEKLQSCRHVRHIKDIPPKRVVALRLRPVVSSCDQTFLFQSTNSHHKNLLLPRIISTSQLFKMLGRINIYCQCQTSVCFVSAQSTSYCEGSSVIASSVLAYRDPLLNYITFYNL